MRKFYLTALSLVLLLQGVLVAQSNWTWQHPLPQGNDLNDVYAFDENTFIAVGKTGTILKTTNSGIDWDFKTVDGNLLSIDFIDANIGFVIGNEGLYKTTDQGQNWIKISDVSGNDIDMLNNNIGYIAENHNIFKTTDGGITWVSKYYQYSEWNSAFFINENYGYCSSMNGILKTTNGGENWTYFDFGYGLSDVRSDVFFINESIGWVITANQLWKTTDSGDTWNWIAISGGDKSQIKFLNENIGWTVGWQDSKIYKTTNGGASWNSTWANYPWQGLNAIGFINENIGFAVGNNGVITKTIDSGASQVSLTESKSYYINDIEFIDENIGYAVGENILRTTDGGDNWDITYTGTYLNLNKVDFVNTNVGFAFGYKNLKTTNGGISWTEFASGISGYHAYGVLASKFLNENTGWWVGEFGSIIKTTDGGSSYIIQRQSSNYDDFVSSIEMLNENEGWSLLLEWFTYQLKLLKTSNSGLTWEPIWEGGYGGDLDLPKIIFKDYLNGFIINGYSRYRTTDGGYSWFEELSLSDITDLYFISDAVGFAVTRDGRLKKTIDGGNIWLTEEIVYDGKLSSIYISTNGNAWVAGGNRILKNAALSSKGLFLNYFPNTLYSGQNYEVTWIAESVEFIKIELSTDVGSSWMTLEESYPADNEFYNWVVPDYLSYSQYDACRFRISDITDSNISSTRSFMIRGLKITYPNGGEIFAPNDHIQIEYINSVGPSVNGYYSIDGGVSWNLIFENWVAPWIIPNVNSDSCLIKVEHNYYPSVDISDSFFTIGYSQPVELLSPQENQTITTEEINFEWSDVGADYYKIIVDNNSGLGSREVFDSVTTTTHTVPGYFLEANTYYWKVIAYFSDGSSIESDVSYFHYDPPKLQAPYWIPLYRLYKEDDKDHFYCTTQEQRLDADSAGYVEEGIEGHISAKPFDHPDMKNIFRLYSDQNKAHFYTTNGDEKDIKIQDGYTYEGIVGFSYANPLPDLVPMYRLKKDFGGTPPNVDYFCTISWAERKNAEDNYGFTYDSIMTYVSPNNGKMTEPLAPGQIMAALGVNTQNGNFQSPAVTSFNIADKGITLKFSHYYNSMSAVLFTDRKPLGPGWTHTYNAYITYSDPNAVNSLFNIVWPDGNIHTYYKEGSNYFCTTPGIYDSIDVVNFPIHIKIIKKDQTIYEFKTPMGALWGSPALLNTIIDKNGNTLTCQYNVVNQATINLLNVTGTTGRQLTFTYYTEAGKENLIKTVQDPAGRTINFEYDTLGNLIRFIDAENKLYNYEYNSPYQQDRLMTKFIFPNGNFIENIYDTTNVNSSNVKYVADQIDGSTSSKFEIRFYNSTPGSPYSTVKDPNGEIWKYTSNPNNTIQQVYNNTFAFAVDFERLDSNNPTLPTRVADGRGNSTSYTYDLKGNVLTVSQPLGINHLFTYDSKNNLTQYKNPRGFDFDYTYDGSSNLTTIATPSGTTALNYIPSSGGLVQSVQNPLSQITSFAYNQYGNIVSVTDPLSNITSYAYDGISRLISVTNAKMQVTSYTYDNRDLIRFVNDPAGQTSYTYDDNGNLRTVTNAKGQITTLNYDPVTDWLISTQNNAGNQTIFGYYPNGLLLSKIDAMTNTTNYYYDLASRLSNIISPSRTATMIYDNNSNLTGLTDNAKNMYFTYDALNRLQNYTDYYGNITTYTYDDAGNVERINYNPGNKTVQYNYDGDNRLTSVTDWNGKQTSYTYRADGTIQQIAYPNSVISSYNYDNASRITGISTTGPSGTIAQYSFTLDALGNHTQENIEQPLSPVPNLFEQSISYTYDLANRIQSAGNMNFTFDANGNLSTRTESGTATSYTFNTENLLTGINNDQASFIYDVFGNRREATRSGVNRRYVLDINGPMSQVLVETDENNNPINYYVYGLGLVSRIKPDGTTHYYHGDFRGSTVAMTNSVGTVTHKYSYDAFGNVIEQDEPDYNPFKYVGAYGVMEETHGLQFMRARYYDPEIGRFISEDPIWDVNLYIYSYNNPIRFVDASGKVPVISAYLLKFSGDIIAPYSAFGGFIVADKVTEYGFNKFYKGRKTYKSGLDDVETGIKFGENVWAIFSLALNPFEYGQIARNYKGYQQIGAATISLISAYMDLYKIKDVRKFEHLFK